MKKIVILLLISISVLLIIFNVYNKDYLSLFINNDKILEEEHGIEYINNLEKENLELPVIGASGYASIPMYLKESKGNSSKSLTLIDAGHGFKIIEEYESWWKVEYNGLNGWVEHKYALINLPDVVPSIIYDNTNSYSAKFLSSGKEIPTITGSTLYNSKDYNSRLNTEEYIMPVLYSTAKKICVAQQNALSNGDTIILYEAFRPYGVQQRIINGLMNLANFDVEVMKGINTYPWSISWFINTNVSNHQKGGAVDVGLAKVISKKTKTCGRYLYTKITEYDEYTMHTQIHELSISSATFTTPVSSKSETEWRKATLSNSMNNNAIKLQSYFTDVGFTPLASEWWHFNDLQALSNVPQNSTGNFIISECFSQIPN